MRAPILTGIAIVLVLIGLFTNHLITTSRDRPDINVPLIEHGMDVTIYEINTFSRNHTYTLIFDVSGYIGDRISNDRVTQVEIYYEYVLSRLVHSFYDEFNFSVMPVGPMSEHLGSVNVETGDLQTFQITTTAKEENDKTPQVGDLVISSESYTIRSDHPINFAYIESKNTDEFLKNYYSWQQNSELTYNQAKRDTVKFSLGLLILVPIAILLTRYLIHGGSLRKANSISNRQTSRRSFDNEESSKGHSSPWLTNKIILGTSNNSYLEGNNWCEICYQVLIDPNKTIHCKQCENDYHISCMEISIKTHNHCPICKTQLTV